MSTYINTVMTIMEQKEEEDTTTYTKDTDGIRRKIGIQKAGNFEEALLSP